MIWCITFTVIFSISLGFISSGDNGYALSSTLFLIGSTYAAFMAGYSVGKSVDTTQSGHVVCSRCHQEAPHQ